MNNRELYKKTFSRLHASGRLDLEVMEMKKRGTGFRCRRSLLVFTAIMTLMLAMSAIAYAATGGEFLHAVKVWIGGGQQEAVEGQLYQSEDGEYVIKVKDVTETDKESSVEMEISRGDSADQ